MPEQLDNLDVRILEGLAEYGPRNIAKVARGLNVPRGTIISMMKRKLGYFPGESDCTTFLRQKVNCLTP